MPFILFANSVIFLWDIRGEADPNLGFLFSLISGLYLYYSGLLSFNSTVIFLL